MLRWLWNKVFGPSNQQRYEAEVDRTVELIEDSMGQPAPGLKQAIMDAKPKLTTDPAEIQPRSKLRKSTLRSDSEFWEWMRSVQNQNPLPFPPFPLSQEQRHQYLKARQKCGKRG